jgi:hypothetical protein
MHLKNPRNDYIRSTLKNEDMKTQIYNGLILTLLLGSILSLSSCFTIGAALITPSQKGTKIAEKDIGVHEGWHKPEYKNVEMKLNLVNNREISGTYKGEDSFETGNEFYQFVRIKTKQKIESIPVRFISQTEIIPSKKFVFEGWHRPAYKNVLLKLDLSNGMEIRGKYKREDTFNTGDTYYQFALIETEYKLEKIPIKYIIQTEYLQSNKMRKGTAVLIGFGLDIALTAIAISSMDFSSQRGDWGFNWFGN